MHTQTYESHLYSKLHKHRPQNIFTFGLPSSACRGKTCFSPHRVCMLQSNINKHAHANICIAVLNYISTYLIQNIFTFGLPSSACRDKTCFSPHCVYATAKHKQTCTHKHMNRSSKLHKLRPHTKHIHFRPNILGMPR